MATEIETERLPFSPKTAIEQIKRVLASLDQIEGHPTHVSKARVLLRGIIGCGIADPHAAVDRADLLREVKRIVNQIYGCNEHDQPSHCADCALRHKALAAIDKLADKGVSDG